MAWSTLPTEKEDSSYEIIYEDKVLDPWKLIRKNQ